MTAPSNSERGEVVAHVRLGGARDPRAVGGAITVELCGAWDHEGPCTWPHRTTTTARSDDTHEVRVTFEAPPEAHAGLRARIEGVITQGELEGPDGRCTSWRRRA